MDRDRALEKLQEHPDDLDYLWKAVIAFENFNFETVGRGQNHTGAVKFRYAVSRNPGAGGRHYAGAAVEGYGNELWIYLEKAVSDERPKAKSISRSTVDLAYRNARKIQQCEGRVSGPRKLGVPGSRSYLYAMFLKFGIIYTD